MTTRTGRASQGKPIVATDPGYVYGFKRGSLSKLQRQVDVGYAEFCKRRNLTDTESFKCKFNYGQVKNNQQKG